MTELPRKTSVIAFVLLYIAYCISYIDRAAISLALAQIGKDFNLQAADLGIVISAFFLGYAAMQVPGGWLSDRFGSKYVVIVTIVMWSLFTAFTSLAWSLISLIAIRFIFGIAEGGFPPASIRAIAEVFKKDSRPKMSGLLLSSNYAGSMVAPLIMAPLILWLGWRHAFNAIGIAGIVFAVVYFVFVPYLGRPGKADAGAPVKAESRAPMRELMKNPLLWQLMVVWFGLSCVNKGLDSWMPLYLLQQRGLDLKTVGVLAPIPFVMATIATAMGGWVMTTFFSEREKYLLIGSSALTGIFLYAMYKSETITMLIAFQSLVYFFKSFVLASVIALPTKLLRDDQIGSGVGMVNLGGQSAGFVAPVAIGFIVTGTGSFDAAFGFLVAMTALSVVVAATISTAQPKLVAQPA
ncbi:MULTISPECIES: MFS transporter [Bradyrhizobium]|uniref:Bll4302 protein n=1 Tax=Bradyrhizobium diazoefficiens (strain JCM 10833 / BCRC 13528 / IAM 13628 / NBRC 14792 / USDA 110) TaxID=224911 RepID=Q89M91_BRADU|nr:MFS transporter [Bradyrhizobium diazoefficiens]MBP1065692.1 sugar phosphate permease [Bradyrhizobium japonicum]AND89581.1 MFS transporter [Bradyrhizobium diazoefficiens USDA 110]AWO91231.1 MFS transporter [Bradyrhizobium diazoefficiens]PDT61243.1 MFS transporter [Bradyrhizobium diazoefficiens]QBP23066.1 MFS transporter [Bradyrhizobium diazoefficiens]